jgi:hypothetical protein
VGTGFGLKFRGKMEPKASSTTLRCRGASGMAFYARLKGREALAASVRYGSSGTGFTGSSSAGKRSGLPVIFRRLIRDGAAGW